MLGLFLTAPAAGGAAPAAGGDMWGTVMQFLPFIAIIVIFYFILIRPESKRKKAVAKMRQELMVGDEITTIGGVIGKIIAIKDDEITIETGADKVRLKFTRWAISAKGSGGQAPDAK